MVHEPDQFSRITPPKPDRNEGSVRELFHDAHTQELINVDGKLEDVKDSYQINHATGRELDEIGKRFGLLGNRLGRNDEQYKAYLKSIVSAYKGRGTVDGIKIAVGSSVELQPEKVNIDEDFEQNSYSLSLTGDWFQHRAGTIINVAEIADPAAVEVDPIVDYTQNVAVLDKVNFTPGKLSEGDFDLSDGSDIASRIDTILIGTGEDETATSMQNTVFEAQIPTTASEEKTGSSSYEIYTEITGGVDVPAESDLSEFGVAEGSKLYDRQVKNDIVLGDGETILITIPIEYNE